MTLNIKRFEQDLSDLRSRGSLLEFAMVRDVHGIDALREAADDFNKDEFEAILQKLPRFKQAYELWYTESLAVIKQVLPDRLADFKRQYERTKGRKDINAETYVIEDYMLGLKISYAGDLKAGPSAAVPKLQNQTAILNAASARFKSSLFELKQIVQADLFDTEILSSRALWQRGFYRAAGAIAGVVLEKHLSQVSTDHGVVLKKKSPGISDYNEALKAASVTDLPQWRHISLLADIRNICDHHKDREPTKDQVSDLIDGTEKVLKTLT